jgi:hypothetical protein
MNSNTYCEFPWYTYSIDVGFGWWRSCPRADYKKLNDLNFFNHAELIDQRKSLRNNIQHPTCIRCWDAENSNAISYRQAMGRDKMHKSIDQDFLKVPEMLEIKFSNLCNLKCIMCSSNCSSLWEQDVPIGEEQFGKYRGDEVSKKILEFADTHYKDIKEFGLFGGEPVITKEFDQLFDLILSKPLSDGIKIISFSTNMYFSEYFRTKFEDKIQALLDRGHEFFLRFSIDGVHEQGEYVRTGLKWNVFEKNLDSFMQRFQDHPNMKRLRCNIALNVTNIVYLDTILNFLENKKYRNYIPHYNYVGKPDYFYIKSYGSRLQKAIEIIKTQDYGEFAKYKDYVIKLANSMSHLEPDLEIIQKGKSWLDEYDAKTNKNFLTLFPKNSFMYD